MRHLKILAACLLLVCVLPVWSQESVAVLGLPLSLRADSLCEALAERGAQRESDREFSIRIAGLRAWLTVYTQGDSLVNSVALTTQEQQGRTLHDDYAALSRWMVHHYGRPQWESTVRSHRFARWLVSPHHDIVMIETATAGIEIYFYQNHLQRQVDYYSILKHCERNPVDGVPQLTAAESVDWPRNAPPTVTKKRSAVKRRAKPRRRRGRTSRRR